MLDCRPGHVITCWSVTKPPSSIPALFLDCLCLIASGIQTEQFPIAQQNQRILKEYYKTELKQKSVNALLHSTVESVSTCWLKERFKGVDLVSEYCVLCPLTRMQAKCLDCLSRRWGFLLKENPKDSPLYLDTLVSLYFEIERVYSHPFLAGCTEQTVLKERALDSWSEAFRRSSSKVRVSELLLDILGGEGSCIAVFVKSIQLAHFYQRFYQERRNVAVLRFHRWYLLTRSLFGVLTVEEMNHRVDMAQQALNEGKQVVAILGLLPSHISLSLSFVRDVIVCDREMDPKGDVNALQSVFGLGVSQPLRIFRLVIPMSFELEPFLPGSTFLQELQQFLSDKSSLFSISLQCVRLEVFNVDVICLCIIRIRTHPSFIVLVCSLRASIGAERVCFPGAEAATTESVPSLGHEHSCVCGRTKLEGVTCRSHSAR